MYNISVWSQKCNAMIRLLRFVILAQRNPIYIVLTYVSSNQKLTAVWTYMKLAFFLGNSNSFVGIDHIFQFQGAKILLFQYVMRMNKNQINLRIWFWEFKNPTCGSALEDRSCASKYIRKLHNSIVWLLVSLIYTQLVCTVNHFSNFHVLKTLGFFKNQLLPQSFVVIKLY